MKKILTISALLLAGCAGIAPIEPQVATSTNTEPEPTESVYVIRRGWHTDVGFPADALNAEFFKEVGVGLPGARYLVFGFGDRHYVLAKDKNAIEMVEALLPGDGLILATGLLASPGSAFGADSVIELQMPAAQAAAIRDFVWHSIKRTPTDTLRAYALGPYPGSLFYAATPRYSGWHTCNTWTADALHAGGLKVSPTGVLFSGQVWHQIKLLPEVISPDVPVLEHPAGPP